MAEAHQARIRNVVEEMVQSLERDHIRKMQVGISLLFCCYRCVCVCTYYPNLFFSKSLVHYVSYFPAGSHVQLQRRLL